MGLIGKRKRPLKSVLHEDPSRAISQRIADTQENSTPQKDPEMKADGYSIDAESEGGGNEEGLRNTITPKSDCQKPKRRRFTTVVESLETIPNSLAYPGDISRIDNEQWDLKSCTAHPRDATSEGIANSSQQSEHGNSAQAVGTNVFTNITLSAFHFGQAAKAGKRARIPRNRRQIHLKKFVTCRGCGKFDSEGCICPSEPGRQLVESIEMLPRTISRQETTQGTKQKRLEERNSVDQTAAFPDELEGLEELHCLEHVGANCQSTLDKKEFQDKNKPQRRELPKINWQHNVFIPRNICTASMPTFARPDHPRPKLPLNIHTRSTTTQLPSSKLDPKPPRMGLQKINWHRNIVLPRNIRTASIPTFEHPKLPKPKPKSRSKLVAQRKPLELLDLAQEILDKIYEHALLKLRKNKTPPLLKALRPNSKGYFAALPTYYKINQFTTRIPKDVALATMVRFKPELVKWLRRLKVHVPVSTEYYPVLSEAGDITELTFAGSCDFALLLAIHNYLKLHPFRKLTKVRLELSNVTTQPRLRSHPRTYNTNHEIIGRLNMVLGVNGERIEECSGRRKNVFVWKAEDRAKGFGLKPYQTHIKF